MELTLPGPPSPTENQDTHFEPRQSSPRKPEPDSAPDPFDPASLRLSSRESIGIGVKRVITTIAVSKPNKQDFVRAHRDAAYHLDTAILEDSVDRQIYLVAPDLWPDLTAEIKPVKLVTAISRHGNVFLWPATLPSPEGRTNRWHESMLAAQLLATEHWVRVQSDMQSCEYTVYQATGNLPEPEWPQMGFAEILRVAFHGRMIQTMDHPVLKALRGEV